MKHFVLPAALTLALAGSLAFAQAPQSTAPDTQATAAQPAPAHAPNPHRQAMRMARELSLTPDQTAKLEPILADRDQKIAALRADPSIAPKAAKKQLRAIRQNAQEQLSAVLTPDQLQQLQSMRHHRSPGGQPQPAASPTA